MSSPIDISWKNTAGIRRKLPDTYRNLKQVRSQSTCLWQHHLLQRALAMNLENKTSSSRTIINMQKNESIIKMWKIICFLTGNNTNSQL